LPERTQGRIRYSEGMIAVRAAAPSDSEAIWSILQPTIREGETYPLPRGMAREAALAWWFSPAHEVFLAEENGGAVGTYFLRANQQGGGAHVANCGYITAPQAMGRGVARAMCAHSLERARARGFRAMQFNFVVSTNERAVRLWQGFGFEIVGRLPGAFEHPSAGFVDALVMYRVLEGQPGVSKAQKRRLTCA
jgi:ribosomal protein S18 acetylase RimI-like enzyme